MITPPELDTVLNTWSEWQSPLRQKPSVVEILSGGHSHNSYRVSDGQQQRVIRLENSASRKLAMSRETEIKNQRLAANKGLAADIFAIGENFLVSDYLIGQHWPEKPTELQLQQLGSALRKLHQLASSDNTFDMEAHIENYWQQLDKTNAVVSPELIQSRSKADKLLKQLAKTNSTPVLCHHDLHPDNILLTTTGIQFLDWEYASVNDRYFDLACLAENLHLTETQLQLCNSQYGLHKIDRERLQDQRFIVRHLESLWWTLQKEKTHNNQDPLI